MLRKIGLGFFSKLYAAAAMFLVSVFFARVLGPTEFGYFSLLITLVPFMSYLIVFGQDQAILSIGASRRLEYSRDKLYSRLGYSLLFNSLLFISVFFIAFLLLHYAFRDIQDRIKFCIYISILTAFIFSVRRVLLVFFRLNRQELQAIIPESVIYPSALLITSIALACFGISTNFYYAATLLLLAAVLSLIPFYRVFSTSLSKISSRIMTCSLWYKQGAVFCCLAVAEGSIFFVDRIMVFNYFGAEFLSYYQIAIRFVEILLIFESAYLLVSMQNIALLKSKSDGVNLDVVCKKQTRLIFIFNTLGAAFLFIFSDFLVFIYGVEFASSIPLLWTFCLFLVLNSFVGSSNYICTIVGLEKKALVATLISVLVFFLIVLFFGDIMSLQTFVIIKCLLDFCRKFYCAIILKCIGINLFLR